MLRWKLIARTRALIGLFARRDFSAAAPGGGRRREERLHYTHRKRAANFYNYISPADENIKNTYKMQQRFSAPISPFLKTLYVYICELSEREEDGGGFAYFGASGCIIFISACKRINRPWYLFRKRREAS
jgi:hypothetical protein